MGETRKLLSNSLVIFIGTIVASAFSYLFNMLMGRMLGPEQYGAMTALFSMMLIVAVGGGALTTVVMKYASELYHSSHILALQKLYAAISRRILMGALGILIIGSILARPIAVFFGISETVPVVIVLGSVVFGYLAAINRGMLQGMQRFGAISFVSVLEMLGKLVIGVALVKAGFSLNGAIGSIVLSGAIVYVATAWLVRRNVAHARTSIEGKTGFTFNKREMLSYIMPTLLATLLTTISLNLDIILVKHLFPANDAGLYAAVSTVGKIILFVTGPVVSVMFPMVAERKTKGDKHYKLLVLSLMLTLLGGLVILGVYTVLPAKVLTVLYGKQYVEYYYLLPQVGLAVLFYSIVNLLANYYLSIKDYVFLWFFAATTILQIGWVYFWHPSLLIVVRIFISTFGLLCFLMIAYYVFTKREQIRLFLKGEYGEETQTLDYHPVV